MGLVAGVLFACLLACGCASQRTFEMDAENPVVRVSAHGVLFGEEYVDPKEVPEILDGNDIPHARVIHILLDPDVRDLRQASFLMACLAKAGYTRSVLVTKRHAESVNLGKRKPAATAAKSAGSAERKRVIRYKKANE